MDIRTVLVALLVTISSTLIASHSNPTQSEPNETSPRAGCSSQSDNSDAPDIECSDSTRLAAIFLDSEPDIQTWATPDADQTRVA